MMMPVLMTFQDGINIPILIAGEVPTSRKYWLTSRLARIAIVFGSYLEFGSDFAAGVTSIKRGHLALGIPIIIAGALTCCSVRYRINQLRTVGDENGAALYSGPAEH